MKSPVFTYDATLHKYSCDGLEMPGVTQILKEAGEMPHYRGTQARDRGTEIHRASVIWDTFGIMPETEEIGQYIMGWKRYLEESKMTIIESEQQVYNIPLWYGGTLDRLMRNPEKELGMLDIKSGAKASWHGLQLAAYALAHPLWAEIDYGIVVYLKANGRYTTQPFTGKAFEDQKNQWEILAKRRKA